MLLPTECFPAIRRLYAYCLCCVSRFFAPAYGIPEDPVTGSAHCCLGPYWMKKLNKNELTAFQASERGGFLKVRVEKDRVFISGKAVFCAELKD